MENLRRFDFYSHRLGQNDRFKGCCPSVQCGDLVSMAEGCGKIFGALSPFVDANDARRQVVRMTNTIEHQGILGTEPFYSLTSVTIRTDLQPLGDGVSVGRD